MSQKQQDFRNERGIALLMVTVLLFVMMIIVTELLSTANVQIFMAENINDEHISFYSEETLLLKIEEVLFQDIEPPPMKPVSELGLTPEEIEIINNKRGTDSYHDYWASQEVVEENGDTWIRATISDEERRFNINTIIDPKTDKIIPKRKAFLDKLLEILEIKRVDAQDIVTNIISSLDKNSDGKFDSKDNKNAPFERITELLALENIEEDLYYGHQFPEGEISSETEEDFFDRFSEVDEFEELLEEEKNKNPFISSDTPVYEEWEDHEIKAGFKDLFTVYGSGKINVNTAPIPLLIALFGEEDVALEVIKSRKKKPITKLDDLKMISGAFNAAAKYGDMIAFTSDFYRIKMEFKYRRMTSIRYAMMKRVGSDIKVLFRGAQ